MRPFSRPHPQIDRPRRRRHVAIWAAIGLLTAGCTTIRITDPPRTATEQYLLTEATRSAVEQLTTLLLRDRPVYVDSTYLSSARELSAEQSFLLGELRARLLLGGARLVPRDEAEVILEVRAGSIGIDRYEYLLGIPSIFVPGTLSGTGTVPLATPELAIVKSTRQYGYVSVAYVAYWNDSGEVLAHSGPFNGRTYREDFWVLGIGPRTVGNIPSVERGRLDE